jgi:hypothetical protein
VERSAHSVRAGVVGRVVVIFTSDEREALEVWAGARSRCHHTFADWSVGLSSVRRTHGPRFTRFVRPHVCRLKSYGAPRVDGSRFPQRGELR